MSPGSGSTGFVLEQMVLPALKNGGYAVKSQVHVGTRLNGGRHMVDVVAEKAGRILLISLKWQQVPGTAEQKVPFEVICLAETVKQHAFSRAYLVLGGEGWSLRPFYTSGGLKSHLTSSDSVDIVTLEWFIAKANRGEL